jgi:hypothetical protein
MSIVPKYRLKIFSGLRSVLACPDCATATSIHITATLLFNEKARRDFIAIPPLKPGVTKAVPTSKKGGRIPSRYFLLLKRKASTRDVGGIVRSAC